MQSNKWLIKKTFNELHEMIERGLCKSYSNYFVKFLIRLDKDRLNKKLINELKDCFIKLL